MLMRRMLTSISVQKERFGRGGNHHTMLCLRYTRFCRAHSLTHCLKRQLQRSKRSQIRSYSIWVIWWFSFHFHRLCLNCISRGCGFCVFGCISFHYITPKNKSEEPEPHAKWCTLVIKCRVAASNMNFRFMKKRFFLWCSRHSIRQKSFSHIIHYFCPSWQITS